MPGLPSPKRYARAIFEIALESGEFDTWQEDLRILTIVAIDKDFVSILDAPQTTIREKRTTIEAVLGDLVSAFAVNLISILTSNKLVKLLPGIADEFGKLVDEHNGVQRVVVTSAVPIDEIRQRQLAEVLKETVEKEVVLASDVDSSILGGIVIRWGDKVIDGSVRTKLSDMRRDLVENR